MGEQSARARSQQRMEWLQHVHGAWHDMASHMLPVAASKQIRCRRGQPRVKSHAASVLLHSGEHLVSAALKTVRQVTSL